tara:strand:+ start:1082 stop:1420 length:339 start_codon:yes stop_codon:yes gene_type:complete
MWARGRNNERQVINVDDDALARQLAEAGAKEAAKVKVLIESENMCEVGKFVVKHESLTLPTFKQELPVHEPLVMQSGFFVCSVETRIEDYKSYKPWSPELGSRENPHIAKYK